MFVILDLDTGFQLIGQRWQVCSHRLVHLVYQRTSFYIVTHGDIRAGGGTFSATVVAILTACQPAMTNEIVHRPRRGRQRRFVAQLGHGRRRLTYGRRESGGHHDVQACLCRACSPYTDMLERSSGNDAGCRMGLDCR